MVSSIFFVKSVKGFTLIELMVAMTIMAVTTVLLLANYPDSTVRLSLLNDSHSVALLIREAQLRGSAIDSVSGTVDGYGIFIDKEKDPTEAILFSDSIDGVTKNNFGIDIGDGLYDLTSVPPDTIKNTFVLKDTFLFKKLCVASSTATGLVTNGFLCSKVNHDDSLPINSLTISFIRPSQVAHIYVNNNKLNEFSSACIQIYSLKTPTSGHVRSIQVLRSGVITTTATSCD
jgi:prepilin-type N-terminal cleavage/methylation domain-containing protein